MDTQNPNRDNHNDEIDLKELFITLWRGKWIIVTITLISILIAGSYAFLAQSWWTSKASITDPSLSKIISLKNNISPYTSIFFDSKNQTIQLPKELDISSRNVLNDFIIAFNSSDNKKQFLNSSELIKEVKQQLKVDTNDPLANKKFNNQWSNNINAVVKESKNSVNTNTLEIELSFKSITSESSLALLNEYIDYTNGVINREIYSNIQTYLNNILLDLEGRKAALESQAQLTLQREIKLTENSFLITNEANINAPIQNLGEVQSEIFPINIGRDALQAKLNVLKNLKDLSIIEPELSTVYTKIDLIKTNTLNTTQLFKSYDILQTPEEPITRDSPKRSLILIIGLLLGGMIGCGVVLTKAAFSNTNRK